MAAIQTGLRGCGTKTALAITAHGFGSSLCSAAWRLSPTKFQIFLCDWRETVRVFLHTDPTRSVGFRQPTLAAALHDDFPDPSIINMYLFPTVSSDDDIKHIRRPRRFLDVIAITRHCELYFAWATASRILPKFEAGLFHSVLLAALTQGIFYQNTMCDSRHCLTVSVGL